ncbi:MAG TPA: hypothetical protein DEB09_04580 [Candidatus Magasanikbacteria bacterium]|nr:hypothetical protein [Candidatus Magasanikbacteria bacterium]
MKKKIFGFLFVFLFVFGLIFSFNPAQALIQTESGPYLGLEYGQATGLGTHDIRVTAALIINSILGILGTVAVCLIVYAGFKWMTAGGNEENVKSAQSILYAAVIGLAIILSAYAISKFVLTNLFFATTGKDYSSVDDAGRGWSGSN